MRSMKSFRQGLFTQVILILLVIGISLPAQVQKRNYAVIGLKNAEGVTAGEAEIIADRLRIELFNTGRVNMMERDQMQEILSEQGFQQSGACTDEACMIEIGQLLGVERLISGSIGKLGSMFLLNFRAIDVQTARIIKVVSHDISGGIEDVVKYLPNIALQLTGEEGEKPPEVVKEKAPETEPESEPEPEVVEAEPEKPVTPTPVPTPEKEEVKEVPKVEKKGKNENRSGVRISFSFFPGDMRGRYYKDEDGNFEEAKDWADEDVYNDYEDIEGVTNVYYNKSLFRFNVHFMIKAGRFITIDVGPGIMLWKNAKGYEYTYYDSLDMFWETEDQDWQLMFIAPNVSTGLNFVLRFYPLKINFGILLDVNLNIIRFREDLVYYYNINNDYHHSNTDFKTNVSVGPRLGVEILGGAHFGFNVDFLLRWYKITTDIDFVTTYDQEWQFKLPSVGFGAGLNFYF